MESDAEYFSRRANEERRQSMSAAHPNAREAHLQIAERYSEMARAIVRQEIILGTRSSANPVS